MVNANDLKIIENRERMMIMNEPKPCPYCGNKQDRIAAKGFTYDECIYCLRRTKVVYDKNYNQKVRVHK